MNMRTTTLLYALVLTIFASAPASALAGGQLIGTGGLGQIEGAAGGGLVPWAVISGYGTSTETSGTAFVSHANVADYQLNVIGASVSFNNRLELSAARQVFTQSRAAAPLDAPAEQDVLGAKLRVLGDLIYDDLPQVSVGIQYKRNRDSDITLLGAERDSDWDAYIAVSRLFLGGVAGRNLLLNGTIRATRANEVGLLGFGGPDNDDHELMAEASAAVFLDRRTAIGYEYRRKPDNLGLRESDWHDVFVAYFPSKSLGLAVALTDLGRIGGLPDQKGIYTSAQASF